MEKAANVAEYIAGFPAPTQKLLKQLRATIKKAAPDADEALSYGMPYYSLNGRLVYFAGYAHHIGLYPLISGIANFKKEIAKYKHAKGSVQFPLDEPLPLKLVAAMVEFRARENRERAVMKAKARTGAKPEPKPKTKTKRSK